MGNLRARILPFVQLNFLAQPPQIGGLGAEDVIDNRSTRACRRAALRSFPGPDGSRFEGLPVGAEQRLVTRQIGAIQIPLSCGHHVWRAKVGGSGPLQPLTTRSSSELAGG